VSNVSARRDVVALIGIVVSLLILAACPRSTPDRRRFPTERQLVASRQAIGIPYDRYIVFRYEERLFALRVTSRSPRGDHISYRWSVAEPESASFLVQGATHGEGQTTEGRYDGRIPVPGLILVWSRGSSRLGWIYWPEGDRPLSVYSRSWQELGDIDVGDRSGKWIRRDMF
jgi:hypothetical protein